MMQEVLKRILEERGIDFQEVMEEVYREQSILTYLKQVGQGAASLLPEGGWLVLEVYVQEDKILVTIEKGTLPYRSLQIDRTQSQKQVGSSGSSGTRDGKGPRVASLLQEAARAHGLALKEWQVRSISYHGPEVIRWLLKETQGAIKSHPAFREAISLYREWHPEKQLPDID